MLHEGRRPNRVHLSMRRIRLAQHLDTDVQPRRDGPLPADGNRRTPHQVSPLAARPLLDLEHATVWPETLPVLVHVGRLDGDIPQAVIVVGPVLVVEAAFEHEPRRGHVGHDPVLLPSGFRGSPQGPSAVGE
jgi:hypothetical protein